MAHLCSRPAFKHTWIKRCKEYESLQVFGTAGRTTGRGGGFLAEAKKEVAIKSDDHQFC